MQLQRYYWPELDDIGKGEWLNLYRVWLDGFLAGLRREERQRIIAHVRRAAREMPPATPFVCVCAVEGDPLDPEYERIHREHVFLAQYDNIGEARKSR